MRLTALALILGALCLCGCGDDSAGTSSTSTATTVPTESQNGEESIEGFGEEAEGEDRDRLLATFHDYLRSIAEGDEQKACTYLAANVRRTLGQLAGQAKQPPGCPELLEALLSPGADEVARSQDEGQVRKVRSDGDTAAVLFHAPGAKLYQLNMAKEGGEWKVSLLSAAVLVPDPH